MSAEHILPKAILNEISWNGTMVRVGGWAGQPVGELRNLGIKALTAKILCREHNEGLSELDSVFVKLWRFIDAANEDPERVPDEVHLPGPLVERAFFKLLCGVLASRGNKLPQVWGHLLRGRLNWPNGTGLHVVEHGRERAHTRQFHLQVDTDPPGGLGSILSLTTHVCGPVFRLVITPEQPGTRRPSQLVFQLPDKAKTMHLDWPEGMSTGRGVRYTKKGEYEVPDTSWPECE